MLMGLAGLASPALAGDFAQLLVKWALGPESALARSGNAQVGAIPIRTWNALRWQVVHLPDGMTAVEGARLYRQLPAVEAVEIDHAWGKLATPSIAKPSPKKQSVTTNDPRLDEQWYLHTIGAPTAWQFTTGGTNVVVAVVDTGIDYTHPDLAANMWVNPGETGRDSQGRDKATNGIDDDGDGYIDDVHGANVADGTGDPLDQGVVLGYAGRIYHGTLVAGIIGAVGNNAVGIAGVNWTARLMAVRAVQRDASDLRGNSDTPFYSDMVAAYAYVLEMKKRGVNVRVTSNSFSSFTTGQALEDALAALAEAGILNVFSAGNDNVDCDLASRVPGGLPSAGILNVAASGQNYALAGFSCYGSGTVDLAAPGVSILTTTGGGDYLSVSGTSFACPLVAGGAALLLSAHPELSVARLKAILLGGVSHETSLTGKVFSNGNLDLAGSFARLADANPPAIVITALPAGRRTTPDMPVQVAFNRTMDRASVEQAFALDPAAPGAFYWAADSQSFQFLPATPWNSNLTYTASIAGTARDTAGGYLDGNFTHNLQGSSIRWTFCFPLANDDWAQALELTGALGEAAGDNRYAMWEVGEPQLGNVGALIRGNTLWYRWTPPAPGWQIVKTQPGAGFDTVVDIFSGSGIDDLTLVASNDDDGTNSSSRLIFYATPGMAYSIRVAGKDAFDPKQSGAFTLAWQPAIPPKFALHGITPPQAIPGAIVTLSGTNFAGALSVLFNGASAKFTNGMRGSLDDSISAVVPPGAISGPITVVTPLGSAISQDAFRVLPPPLSVTLANDDRLEITWPATSSEFILEGALSLSPGAWSVVNQMPTRDEEQSRVTSFPTAGQRFFRLRAP